MNSSASHPQPVRPVAGAYTLIEMMIAASMTAVVLVAALTGVVTLQHSYASTETYATGMADQMRLLDYLALDLRRAVTATSASAPYTLDLDGQGLQITVPDYYHFNASDPQHQFPVANDPTYDSAAGASFYSSTGATSSTPLPTQVIAYRFNNGSITRNDPWQPLVADGKGGYVSSGPVTIASNMKAFPTLVPETTDTTGGTVHYNITFYSDFQPLATQNTSDAITLHNVTFVRSKNLAH